MKSILILPTIFFLSINLAVAGNDHETTDTPLESQASVQSKISFFEKSNGNIGGIIDAASIPTPKLIPGGLIVLDGNGKVVSIESRLTTGTGDVTVDILEPERHIWLDEFVTKAIATNISILSFVSASMTNDDRSEVKLQSEFDLIAGGSFTSSMATPALKASYKQFIADGSKVYFVNSLRYTVLTQKKYTKLAKRAKLSGVVYASGGVSYSKESSNASRRPLISLFASDVTYHFKDKDDDKSGASHEALSPGFETKALTLIF